MRPYNITIVDGLAISAAIPTKFINPPPWAYLTKREDIFNLLVNNLCFSSNFTNIADNFTKNIPPDTRINVLHLRLENDGIQHWSKMNKMSPDIFSSNLINKYTNLIETYFDKNDVIIILSYDLNNKVIEYLKSNNYNFIFREKNKKKQEREIDAIIDLLIGRKCNNVFIGAGGSTFSHILSKGLKNKTSIMLHLNSINNPTKIIQH